MEKVNSKTLDIINENLQDFEMIFPECISDGKVDIEKFKNIIGDYIVDSDEKYEFTWNGKIESLKNSQEQSQGTLLPIKDKGVNWDNTENVYIEGDNLEVLKILQKSYNRKVKMIYIDPPYNTGNDFVYNDSFDDSLNNYVEQTNQENRANIESSGRFHTNWLNMMYPRLRLAKNLLSDDGVIFISIDDGEVGNLRKICDEIFGEKNFVANLIWQKKFSRSNDATYFSTMHDHILCYCKNNKILNDEGWGIGLLSRGDDLPSGYSNPDNDPRGPWTSVIMSAKSGGRSMLYEITTPSGRKVMPPSGRYWSCSQETFEKWKEDNRIWFGKDGNGTPRKKTFLAEVQSGLRPNTILFHEEAGHNQEGKQEVKDLFDGKGVFDGPKPVRLIDLLIKIANLEENDIVLDFFSGSATTAHAAFKYNLDNKKSIKFILIQLPELCPKDSIAFEEGYKTICDIGEERIRRAGAKIKEENGILAQNLDTGFKVFKLDSSNIKLWNGDNLDINNANEYFYEHMDPIVEGRTEEDLLYEILIKEGMMLSSPIEEKLINNKKIYSIGMGYMIVCLNDDIDIDLVREIGKLNPETVIFKDSGFVDENAKANALQELKKLGIEEEKVKSI